MLVLDELQSCLKTLCDKILDIYNRLDSTWLEKRARGIKNK
jgi:hypothetical protein